MGILLLAIFVIPLVIVCIMFSRASRGKGVITESPRSEFFEERFKKEVYNPLAGIMTSLTGPNIKMVLRGEESLGKDCVGVFIGEDDPSADQLAVPDAVLVPENEKPFYGYRLYAAEVFLGSPEPHIQVTYERGRIDKDNRNPLILVEVYSFNNIPNLLISAERWFRKTCSEKSKLLKLQTAP